MQHDDSLVFIEVRYRKNTGYGRAAETVTAYKQRRLVHCAQVYMQRHRAWSMPARFDVVSIEGEAENLRVDWISNAFEAAS